jgi:hypothetical protein
MMTLVVGSKNVAIHKKLLQHLTKYFVKKKLIDMLAEEDQNIIHLKKENPDAVTLLVKLAYIGSLVR